jgi:ketosteroid isomerase-like protein
VKSIAALIASLLLLTACASTTPAAPEETVRQFLAALGTGDAAIGELFTADASVFFPFPDQPLRADGRTAIAEAFGRVFAQPGFRKGSGPAPEDLATRVNGDVAVVTFQTTNPNVTARRTFVLRREGRRWRIAHLHASNVRAD